MYQMLPAATFWQAAKWEEMCGMCNLFHVLQWFLAAGFSTVSNVYPIRLRTTGHVQYVATWWRTDGVSILLGLIFSVRDQCLLAILSSLLIMSFLMSRFVWVFFLDCWLPTCVSISYPLEISSHDNWNPHTVRLDLLYTQPPGYHLISGLK